jgi:taurine-pyruvate aminotransferase
MIKLSGAFTVPSSEVSMSQYHNDPASVIESDRAHVWHHLAQHKPFETIDPQIIVEGKGMRA